MRQKVKLHEVDVLIRYSTIIAAVSKEDALKHVATWEQAWHEHADMIEVLEPEVLNVQTCELSEIEEQAHDCTEKASNIIKRAL